MYAPEYASDAAGEAEDRARAFRLRSRWRLEAPVEAVWAALTDVCGWPQWWPNLRAVEPLAAGAADGTGAVYRYLWRARLPYRLRFTLQVTRVEPPLRLEGRACGQLDGRGVWTLAAHAGITEVDYRWAVDLRHPLLGRLAPLLGPVYAWNHHQVMAAGARGLAQRLGVRLLGCEGAAL